MTAERCLQRPLLEGDILASMLAIDVAMTLCRLELPSKKRLDKAGILKTITKAEAERRELKGGQPISVGPPWQ